MKNVFIRVGTGFAEYEAAEKHMQSLGYHWDGFDTLADKLAGWNVVVLFGRSNSELTHSSVVDEKYLYTYGFEEVYLPTTKHKHYDLIVKWAADTSQKVWYKGSGDDWRPVEISPSWRYEYDWYIGEQPPKRKLMIGDVEIDAPEIESPRVGTEYFVPNIGRCCPADMIDWRDSALDSNMLKRGLVHLNKEAAIAHAKALIKVSGGCVDE